MPAEKQESPVKNKSSFELTRWYYVLVFVLAIFSFITLSRNFEGEWEVTLGIGTMTAILVALAILPSLLSFLVRETPRGTKLTAKIPNIFDISVERVHEIEEKIAENQKKHEKAGEAAKDQTMSQSDIENIMRNADADLEKTVAPQELPFVQQTYLQKLNELVKSFNRNRHLRISGKSSVAEADQIVYKMRAMAPLLFGQLDISAWLDNPNMGKCLAAIKYLDWVQDIEYAAALADKLQELEDKGDTFQAYHVLLALKSMANQLAYDYRDEIKKLIEEYVPSGTGHSSRAYLKNRILEILSYEQAFSLES